MAEHNIDASARINMKICKKIESAVDDPETIYDKYAESLYRYALTLTYSQHDAEDAIQDVFIRFIEILKHKKVANIKNYLYTSVRNASFTILRKRRNSKTTDLSDAANMAINNDISVDSIVLKETFMRLPAEQREVILLKVYDDMTFKEIAKLIGISLGTATSRYRYGIDKLRSILEACDE